MVNKENLSYFISEGLDKIIPIPLETKELRALDDLQENQGIALPPEIDDLCRLHQLVRSRKSFTILEFGLGFSTLVLADALMKNEQDWNNLKERPSLRNNFLFKLFSVDASEKWIEVTHSNIPDYLKKYIQLSHSEVSIGTYNGQLCHYYDTIPDIIPDFIYLDGPDPKDVKGTINGLSFKPDERTVMSADLLLMESTFLPGTFIIVDGRTNNCRFLQNNFKRKYKVKWDKEGDVTTFELDEERLGKLNIIGSDLF